jgi:hypothetical protein
MHTIDSVDTRGRGEELEHHKSRGLARAVPGRNLTACQWRTRASVIFTVCLFDIQIEFLILEVPIPLRIPHIGTSFRKKRRGDARNKRLGRLRNFVLGCLSEV